MHRGHLRAHSGLRRINVSLGGAPLASKIVTLPSKQVVAVSVPSTILANQDISITVKDGIVDKYDLKRDSTILGLVKIPGAILSGLVTGVTDGLTGEKSIIDKREELADSEKAARRGGQRRAIKSVVRLTWAIHRVKLQNVHGRRRRHRATPLRR